MSAELHAALEAYDLACRLPDSIPEQLSWDSRKEAAREAAKEALYREFVEHELESLYWLTKDLFETEPFEGNA